jgi:redox-sensitive bicupin YhaK (pirin superfamily)
VGHAVSLPSGDLGGRARLAIVTAAIDLRPAATLFETVAPGVTSRHAFSYGVHYDAANTSFGLLIAHNDDLLAPGAGYPDHPHRDLDIVSWVVEGSLRHRDGLGSAATLGPGTAQLLHAGSGVRHAERNASPATTRYVQMWIAPDVEGPPGYQVAAHTGSGFVPMASGVVAAPLSLRAPATFSVARLSAGEQAVPGSALFVYLSVVRGTVALDVDGATVSASDGDTVRITAASTVSVHALGGSAEVLAWSMDSCLHS